MMVTSLLFQMNKLQLGATFLINFSVFYFLLQIFEKKDKGVYLIF
jgi:hypothetical protein